MRNLILLYTCLILVTACGGGSQNSSVNSPNQPTQPDSYSENISTISGISIYIPSDIATGQAVGIAAYAHQGHQLEDIQWQQVSGPVTVDLLASHSEVIGFDTTNSGQYQFEFTAMLDGNSVSQLVTLSVDASNQIFPQLRIDHAAAEQLPESNNARSAKYTVSLRLDAAKSIRSIQWQQVSGPSVELEEVDNEVFFTPPAVNTDQLIEILASVTFSDGSTGTDSAFVVIKNTELNQTGYFPYYYEQVVTELAHPYHAESPYADVLVDCIYSNQLTDSCSFNQLPLLGMQTTTPTIDDILDRLVVSHQWMGERFEQYLRQSAVSEDMLKLFRATTGIVIAYDVRPSFYWSATGAIYIDADNLWITPEERDTVNTAPDYRSQFGDQLNFSFAWNYVKNNQLVFSYYPAQDRLTRSFSDMEAELSWLFYHELAHANDYLGPAKWATLDRNSTPLAEAQQDRTNTTMTARYPLSSEVLINLADKRYNTNAGEQPNYTTTELNYIASDLAPHFSADPASDFYSYSSEAEDLAMIFQHTMMISRLDYDSVVAIVDGDNIVGWGQFNRVASTQLKDKTEFIVSQILPEVDSTSLVEQLSASALMQTQIRLRCSMAPADPVCLGGKPDGNRISVDPSDFRHIATSPALPPVRH